MNRKRYQVLGGGTVVHCYLSAQGIAALAQLFEGKQYANPVAERSHDLKLGCATIVWNVFSQQYLEVKPADMKGVFDQHGLDEAVARAVAEDPDGVLFQVYWHDYLLRSDKSVW